MRLAAGEGVGQRDVLGGSVPLIDDAYPQSGLFARSDGYVVAQTLAVLVDKVFEERQFRSERLEASLRAQVVLLPLPELALEVGDTGGVAVVGRFACPCLKGKGP